MRGLWVILLSVAVMEAKDAQPNKEEAKLLACQVCELASKEFYRFVCE